MLYDFSFIPLPCHVLATMPPVSFLSYSLSFAVYSLAFILYPLFVILCSRRGYIADWPERSLPTWASAHSAKDITHGRKGPRLPGGTGDGI